MALARIRTSDPEIIEFLSRHLADSGYQLQFVRPGEPVQGEAELEIDASRMDLAAAISASRHEAGFVSVLSGVLKAELPRDIFEEAAQAPVHREYADVSPYAQGAELEDQPSVLRRAADTMATALGSGMNSVGRATKAASNKLGTWKTQWDANRAARREQREHQLAIEAERRREEQARRAEVEVRRRAEEERLRAEEERLAVARQEEMARLQAEERRRREEQARIDAIAAQQRAEEERRLQAQAAQRRAEEESRRDAQEEQRRAEEARRLEEQRLREQEQLRMEEERGQADELAPSGIERQRQEELRGAEETRLRAEQEQWQEQEAMRLAAEAKEIEEERGRREQEDQWRADAERAAQMRAGEEEKERQRAALASQENSLNDSEAATFEDSIPETEWQPVDAPEISRQEPVPQASVFPDRRRRSRRFVGHRERAFRRAGIAAAIVAVAVISLWSLASIRRPANPLTQEQLMRSAAVEQQRPFGPASTVAPVIQPAAKQSLRPTAPAKRTATNKPKTQSAKAPSKSARRRSTEGGGEVVVRHFAPQKQVQATAKTKNGVKIISESD